MRHKRAQINSAVCIAGAHRSGTSMLTRLLHKSGLNLGPESELMPARADNPDGFWENIRFVSLNDEVLNEIGGAWDLPPPVTPNFRDAGLDPLRLKAQALIAGFDSSPIWGWKDPRNSLTIPFWRDLLPALKLVIIVRNPMEAAYSMRKRNGTSYAFGLRLWEIYNRRLIAEAKNISSLVTHYDSFFADPKAELQRLAAFIGLPFNKIDDAVAVVTSERRHTHFTFDQLIDARVSNEIIGLYCELLREAGRLDVEGVGTQQATGVTARSKQSEPWPGAANRLCLAVPELETTRRELSSARNAYFKLEKNHQELERELERNRQELERELERNRQELERNRQEWMEELAQTRERFTATNSLLHEKSVSLAMHETRLSELTVYLRRQLRSLKKLFSLLEDVSIAAEKLRSSRRWKIANPITALKARLLSQPRLLGYGHLERIIDAFSSWRKDHPEAAKVDEAIRELASGRATSVTIPLSLNGDRAPLFVPAAPTEPIAFLTQEKIDISIIIPVFNQLQHTQSCLASIQRHQDKERFEIIVVDDGSSDGTAETIAKIPGLVCLRNESNLGFVGSCNRGAAAARGDFLLFLNNDTNVTASWLAALRETFEIEPTAGAVGSKLVFPDGRLQEAGGIVWRDGSAWNRGKFQDPNKPEYNYLREVDYCSAASLMVPKDLFVEVGGFSDKYAPAYYEDTDLAFKIAKAGRKVLYQPLSVVVHYEGVTAGKDLSSGAKKYQEANRNTFVSTWADVLAAKPLNGDLANWNVPKDGQKRVLVIDHHLPFFDRDSGSLRMFQIATILRRLGHHVTFLPDNLTDVSPYGDELRKRGVEVIHHPYAKSVREYLQAKGPELELVILSRCQFARKHIGDVKAYAPQVRLIFDTVDLHFLREQREAELMHNAELERRASETRRLEYSLIDKADETWVVSPVEQNLLRQERPDSVIELVPNIVDVPGSATPFALRRDILFVGSFQHAPNVDAVKYFAAEILPLIQEQFSDVKFYIIGEKPPAEILSLASSNILVTGLQSDISIYFNSIKLSVAPLRFGAGVKGKINQSMAFGVPVVATALAVEGMDLENREHVLIADTASEFAQAVCELYANEELWTSISQNALAKTEELYSVRAATDRLQQLISPEQFVAGETGSTLPQQVATEPSYYQPAVS